MRWKGEEGSSGGRSGDLHVIIFCLRGKGIASLRGNGRGDQVIETVVTVPTNLTRRQEELLKEFARLQGDQRGP